MDKDLLIDALAMKALLLIHETNEAIQNSAAPQKIKDNELFSRMKLDMVKAHNCHTQLHLYRTRLELTNFNDSRIGDVMKDILKISALSYLAEGCSELYQCGFLSLVANKNIKLALDQMIAKIRPQVVPLCEAFDIPEIQFPSSIGNRYGDIYEQ